MMRRAIACVLCAAVASPALADPDPPHPNLPEPPADDPPVAPPSDSPTPAPPPAPPPPEAPPPRAFRPAINPALPVVTVATMPVPIYGRDSDSESRLPAWIMTGVVVAFGTAGELWWLHRDKFELRGLAAATDPNCTSSPIVTDPNCYARDYQTRAILNHNQHVWNWVEGGILAGMGLSAFIAGYLWSRHYKPLHVIGYQPANGGGTVSLDGSF